MGTYLPSPSEARLAEIAGRRPTACALTLSLTRGLERKDKGKGRTVGINVHPLPASPQGGVHEPSCGHVTVGRPRTAASLQADWNLWVQTPLIADGERHKKKRTLAHESKQVMCEVMFPLFLFLFSLFFEMSSYWSPAAFRCSQARCHYHHTGACFVCKQVWRRS